MDSTAEPRKRGRPEKAAQPLELATGPKRATRKRSTAAAPKSSTAQKRKTKAERADRTAKVAPATRGSAPRSRPITSDKPTAAAGQSKILEKVAALDNGSRLTKIQRPAPESMVGASQEQSNTSIYDNMPKASTSKEPDKSTLKSTLRPKQLNAFVVNDLSARAHPLRQPPKNVNAKLPPGYNKAASKWLRAIVALPIFFVTSWMLFDRVLLGNERKKMPRKEVEDSKLDPDIKIARNDSEGFGK